MSRKYTDSEPSASANPDPNITSNTLANRSTGSQRISGLPAMTSTMHNSVNSIANCTQACVTLANTKISLGNATRRTSPAFPVIEPRPMLHISAKKFQGIKPQSKNRAKLSSSLGSPTGATPGKITPNTNQ